MKWLVLFSLLLCSCFGEEKLGECIKVTNSICYNKSVSCVIVLADGEVRGYYPFYKGDCVRHVISGIDKGKVIRCPCNTEKE